MELMWMLAICLTAIVVAFIIGERIDKTVFLKLEIRDPERLMLQLEALAHQGVRFAKACYKKEMISKEQISQITREYIKSNLELLYKTKIVAEEGVLEQLIEKAMENDK